MQAPGNGISSIQMGMEIIETHAHLDHPKFADDLEDVIARAHEAGVTRIISIGTSLESSRRVVARAERFPSVFAVVGVHPTDIGEEKIDFIEELRQLAQHSKVVALGEIGIDYFHLPKEEAIVSWKERQAVAFQQQLDLALELGLNVIIHQRDEAGSLAAWEDTLRILHPYTQNLHSCSTPAAKSFVTPMLEASSASCTLSSCALSTPGSSSTAAIINKGSQKLRAVFHCFGGTPSQAARVIDMGHLVSFTGIITFKNAPLVRETATSVPAGNYMVETDAPYLAPVPYRGQRAEPFHTRFVAEKIAEVRGVSLEEVAKATTATAKHFFKKLI